MKKIIFMVALLSLLSSTALMAEQNFRNTWSRGTMLANADGDLFIIMAEPYKSSTKLGNQITQEMMNLGWKQIDQSFIKRARARMVICSITRNRTAVLQKIDLTPKDEAATASINYDFCSVTFASRSSMKTKMKIIFSSLDVLKY